MSSPYVRLKIKEFLEDEIPAEKIIYMDDAYQEIKQLLVDNSVGPEQDWIGVEFLPSDEVPTTIGSTNIAGRYSETGGIYFHFVAMAYLGVGASILARAEILRNKLRGQRIEDILIESVQPVSFKAGATLQFEQGYISGSFLISYERELNIGS